MSFLPTLLQKFFSLVSNQLPDTRKMQWQKFQNKSANRAFLSSHPSFPLPPNELLFETGQINYHWYLKSGREAAAEIASFCHHFQPTHPHHILDWGCGVGRVTRQLPEFFPEATILGTDINQKSIDWLKAHCPGIQWLMTDELTKRPPTSFDLIIGISVFTHIPTTEQTICLQLLHHLLEKDGLAYISTRGSHYDAELTTEEKKQLSARGMLTCGGKDPGSRAMRTYHTQTGMQTLLRNHFDLLLYYDGKKFPGVLGGQDLWLIKKTAQSI
jgi:cyclopropane fatty-acyl-phospholipid synthase-like methyltransferase